MSIQDDARQSLDDHDHDRRLIGLLRHDGRAPVSKLAQIMGLSRGTVQSRLDRLLASGTLLGFTARVREDGEGNAVRAVMMNEGFSRSRVAAAARILATCSSMAMTPVYDGKQQMSTVSLHGNEASLSWQAEGVNGVLPWQ